MRLRVTHVLGIDIGGTKLAVGVVRSDGGQLTRARAPTLVESGPDAAIERLVELCRDTVREARLSLSKISAIGIGCGGPLDPVRGVTLAPQPMPMAEIFES